MQGLLQVAVANSKLYPVVLFLEASMFNSTGFPGLDALWPSGT